MDNKIRTTLVAAAVSSVLTSTAFAASHSISANDALSRYDHNVAQARMAKNVAKAPNVAIANTYQQTQNLNKGIKRINSADHVDSLLNVNTFSWATEEQKISAVPFNVLNRKSAISQASLHFAEQVGSKHGVSAESLAQADLKYVHDTGRGALISKYQQKVNGLEVFQRQLNVVMNQDMQLVATTGYFANVRVPRQPMALQFKVNAVDAINHAFNDMTGDSVELTAKADKANFKIFAAAESENYTFSDDPRAKMLYYPGLKKLIPAYYVELMASQKGTKDLTAYGYVISAQDGKILNRNSLTHNDAFTYKVFADAQAPFTPYDSPLGNDLSPHPTGVPTDVLTETQAPMNDVTLENSGISTNDPWLPAGATVTTGNNVDAYADLVAPDGFTEATTDDDGNVVAGDVRAQTTSDSTFDYAYTHGGDPTSETNINAAIVSLFYTINYLHDLYYDHGFTETAGTAQMDNYGRGGAQGDPIHAQAQDHSGVNNATMATPTDGFSPRMHMFVWSAGTNALNVGDLVEVPYQVSSTFGTQSFELSANLVRMTDGDSSVGTDFDGCQPATNGDDLSGMIALVDRGDCNFTLKARHAQEAGAIAVLVANNDQDAPDATINMGGDDGADIIIPAAMVSYNTGQAILAELEAGRAATSMGVTLEVRDGTVDNPIVEHEWGHYLSHRLTGGGMYANSQGGSMGEGWGDFIALMTMVREEDQQLDRNDHWQGVYNDGGYAINNGFIDNAYYYGLRRVPYSTDMAVNALTFKHIQDQVALPETHPINASAFGMAGGFNAEVHAAGEIWALALWEAYAALLNRDGVSFSDAQSRMMDYMVAGMKITPTSPTYTEARDAILAAAIANNVDDYNVMRDAFTKRGMGPNAVSPDRNDPGWDRTANSQGHAGVVEDFTSVRTEVALDSAILDTHFVSANGAFCDTDDVLDAGETGAVRFSLRNVGTVSLEGVMATISSPADVTFGNNGMVEFDKLTNWNDVVTGLVEITLNSARTNDVVPLTITFSSNNPDVRVPESIETSVEVNRDVVKDATITTEMFESRPAVAADWSQVKIGPANSGHFVGLDDWTVIDVGFGTGNTMMGPDGRVQTDISLMSPMVDVAATGEFAMDFIHYYELESSPLVTDGENIHWDGAVMEVSVDGGDWMDVVDAGGSFATGYNGVINPGGEGFGPNPSLGGRNGFVNTIETQWITPERLTFPEGVMNGHSVQIRFRIGTDGSVGAWGWNLDDVMFTNATNAPFSSVIDDSGVCVNRPPAITTQEQEVIEATGADQNTITLSVVVTDHDDGGQNIMGGHFDSYEEFAAAAAQNNSAFTYNWSQAYGPSVTLDDSHSATPSFTAPVVGEDTTLKFNVEVSDGMAASTATVSVKVTNVNSAPMITDVTGPTTVVERQEVSLHAMAVDPEGDSVTYHWTQTSGTAAQFSSTTDTLTFEAPEVAVDEMLTFAVAGADAEFTGAAKEFSFMVTSNSAPTITAAASAVEVDEKKSVTISVNGNDPDGDTLTYTWTVDGSVVSNTTASYAYTAPKVTQDTSFVISVTASDGLATSNTAIINVNVNNTSSGAGMGLISLLLAPLAFIRRRRQK